MKRSILVGIILSLLAVPALAQDRDQELKALIAEFNKAQQQYFEPLSKAKTDEDRMKVKLDPKLHPARKFLPKFQALAKNAHGSPAEKGALVWIGRNANSVGDQAAGKEAYDRLIDSFADSPDMAENAMFIRYGYYSKNASESKQALRKLADRSKNKEVKAAALYNLAQFMIEREGGGGKLPADAVPMLQQIKRDYPDTKYGKMADATIFAAEKLQIGKPAPDFTAMDEKGATFKLSDYKGKVVVLDFWGFW